MADSLGGNAKTLMFVNVSPASSNTSETLSALNFAKRCKQVQNSSSATVETAQIRQLKKQILAMKAQNALAASNDNGPGEIAETTTDQNSESNKESNGEDAIGEMVSPKKSRSRKFGRRSSFIDPKLTMSSH